MSRLLRPTPDTHLLDLTRRLAEDYYSIPLTEVSRVVREAAATATGGEDWSGTPQGIPDFVAVIDYVAREDLDEARRTQGSLSRRKSARPAQPVTDRRRRRRVAE
jgi:hypothetical protein